MPLLSDATMQVNYSERKQRESLQDALAAKRQRLLCGLPTVSTPDPLSVKRHPWQYLTPGARFKAQVTLLNNQEHGRTDMYEAGGLFEESLYSLTACSCITHHSHNY